MPSRSSSPERSCLPWQVCPRLYGAWKSFVEAAGDVLYAKQTIAVVMTHSMATDIEALDGILRADFDQIGLMGTMKIKQARTELSARGYNTSQLQRIQAPVGLI